MQTKAVGLVVAACLVLLLSSTILTPLPGLALAPSEVKVAVLNSTEDPAYGTGAYNNFYADVVNMLTDMGFQAEAVTSADIDAGALSNYDVLLLIDNLPAESAVPDIKSFWENKGGLVVFDSSICLLCYAGILPAASAGHHGLHTYWEYTIDGANGIEIAASHPVTAGYSPGNVLYPDQYASDDAAYSESAMSSQPEWSHVTVLARYVPNPDLIAALAYDPPSPSKGRVVFIWCDNVVDSTIRDMVKNAILWTASKSVVPSGPGPAPTFGIDPMLLIIIGAIIVIVIIIVVVVLLLRRKPTTVPTAAYYPPPPPPPSG